MLVQLFGGLDLPRFILQSVTHKEAVWLGSFLLTILLLQGVLSELRKQPELDIIHTLKVKVYVAELI